MSKACHDESTVAPRPTSTAAETHAVSRPAPLLNEGDLGALLFHRQRSQLLDLIVDLYGEAAKDRMFDVICEAAQGVATNAVVPGSNRKCLNPQAVDKLRQFYETNSRPDADQLAKLYVQVLEINPDNVSLALVQQYFRRRRYFEKSKQKRAASPHSETPRSTRRRQTQATESVQR